MYQSTPPFYYDYVNYQSSHNNPSTVHTKNTRLHRYYTRYLLQKAISVFEWKLPDNWDKSFFLYTLYSIGFITIFDSKEFGVIPQICGLKGYDLYYRPANCLIVNPFLKREYDLRIDEECVLVKLMPDYGGLLDMIMFYADLMSLACEAVGTNLVNSKMSYIFAGDNKTQAESYKKMYDQISRGETAVFIDKNLYDEGGNPRWQMFEQNVSGNYIGTDVLNDLQSIEASFATEIGIPNNDFEKKERLLTDEVNSNNTETSMRCELWMEEIQKQFKKANEMFDLDLSVAWRHDPLKTTQEGGGILERNRFDTGVV